MTGHESNWKRARERKRREKREQRANDHRTAEQKAADRRPDPDDEWSPVRKVIQIG